MENLSEKGGEHDECLENCREEKGNEEEMISFEDRSSPEKISEEEMREDKRIEENCPGDAFWGSREKDEV